MRNITLITLVTLLFMGSGFIQDKNTTDYYPPDSLLVYYRANQISLLNQKPLPDTAVFLPPIS